METEKESFIRWQGRTIEGLGNAITLLLSLCLATIGFVISKLLDKDFQFQNCAKNLIIIGAFIVLLSILLILILICNRLAAFRLTAQIARKREKQITTDLSSLRQKVKRKDKFTWILFKLVIFTFSMGEVFIIIGFIIEIMTR